MARGGIYTADLAAKERRIKMETKEKIRNKKRKQSTPLNQHNLSSFTSVFLLLLGKLHDRTNSVYVYILKRQPHGYSFPLYPYVCVAVVSSSGPVCLMGSRDLSVIGWRGVV